jgi:hypothetical protein
MFDHKKMRHAEFKLQGPKASSVEAGLKTVIEAFADLQEARLSADYDFGRNWSRIEVTDQLATAEEAFKTWRIIRKEKIAQDHLLTMFGARRT